MNETSVAGEIRQIVADKVAAGVVVHVDWLTAEIIGKKSDISGDDLPFFMVCAHTHVRGIVSRCIARYNPKEAAEDDPQLILPGFKYLQVAYSIMRDGDIVLVPIEQCTDAEIRGRMDDFKKQAIGLQSHRRELGEYLNARKAVA